MKIGIVTIIDNNNYGNRLQNYAVQEYLKKYNIEAITLKNDYHLNSKKGFIINFAKFIIRKIIPKKKVINKERVKCFEEFNRKILFSKHYLNIFSKISKKYDFFIVGSDQVWMPYYQRLKDVDLLTFAKNDQKISFAASFGVVCLPNEYKESVKNNLKTFKALSVREDAGKKIIEDFTGRTDVAVLIDPTMLLSNDEWNKIIKKPKHLKSDKYVLIYFLGNYSKEIGKKIKAFANKNHCEVIDVLDKNSIYYGTGPSEFLYLIKNAYYIFTDSFHSCVFSILFKKPFIVFDRLGENNSINSRIETLLTKFNLQDHFFDIEKNSEFTLIEEYKDVFKILNAERKKTDNFIKKALNIK